MIKISMIMPVYNSKSYLESAIQSVLNQTLEEWELLLVDDGSSDGSGDICDRVAKTDCRIRVIHQKNQGISVTRNIGIQNAIGEYIGFMDNDDIIEPDLLETALLEAEKNDADIVKYGYAVEESFYNGRVEKRIMKTDEKLVISKVSMGKLQSKVRLSGYFNMIWNGIYRTSFIRENGICFDEKIKYGYEDWIFNSKCYPSASKQVILPYVGYIHFQREEHSTSKRFHTNQLNAVIYAMQCENEMFEIIDPQYLNSMEWFCRIYSYLVEFLLLFERKGCHYSVKEKCIELEKISSNKLFSNLKNETYQNQISTNKRLTIKLFLHRRFRLLLMSTQFYSKFIVWKKTRKQKGNEK